MPPLHIITRSLSTFITPACTGTTCPRRLRAPVVGWTPPSSSMCHPVGPPISPSPLRYKSPPPPPLISFLCMCPATPKHCTPPHHTPTANCLLPGIGSHRPDQKSVRRHYHPISLVSATPMHSFFEIYSRLTSTRLIRRCRPSPELQPITVRASLSLNTITPVHVVASSLPPLSGELLPPPPCSVPYSCCTRARVADCTTWESLASPHRSCHRERPESGDCPCACPVTSWHGLCGPVSAMAVPR
jgi:hypothetical protein